MKPSPASSPAFRIRTHSFLMPPKIQLTKSPSKRLPARPRKIKKVETPSINDIASRNILYYPHFSIRVRSHRALILRRASYAFFPNDRCGTAPPARRTRLTHSKRQRPLHESTQLCDLVVQVSFRLMYCLGLVSDVACGKGKLELFIL